MTEAPPPAGTASSNLLTMLGSGFLTNPYPAYASLQSSSPVLWAPGVFGIGAWIATSHAICSSVLRDKRFIKEGQRVLSPEKMAMIPLEGNADLMERRRSNMLFRDPPDHTRLRGLAVQQRLGAAFGRIMFSVPPVYLPGATAVFVWLGLMLLIAVVACAWPALRAIRVPTARALSYE